MSFFNSKNKIGYTLSISLKSSSITLQLITPTQTNKKEVVFLQKKVLFLENSQDPILYMNQYRKELSAILDTTHIEIKKIIGNSSFDITLILYAPWFTCTLTPLLYKQNAVLSESFFANQLKQIQTDPNLRILEKRILKIESNGYNITYSTHLKVSNIEMQVYTSYISKESYEILTQTLLKYFPTAQSTRYRTSPMLIQDQITKFIVQEDNLVFLHIGAEITEVGILQEDALSYFATFPTGTHDFLRILETTTKSYDYDSLQQKQVQLKSDTQKETFQNLSTMWVSSVIQILENFNKNIPHKFILVSDSKTKDFFTGILANYAQNNPESMFKKHRIIDFDISLLKDIITHKTPVGENEIDLKLEALI